MLQQKVHVCNVIANKLWTVIWKRGLLEENVVWQIMWNLFRPRKQPLSSTANLLLIQKEWPAILRLRADQPIYRKSSVAELAIVPFLISPSSLPRNHLEQNPSGGWTAHIPFFQQPLDLGVSPRPSRNRAGSRLPTQACHERPHVGQNSLSKIPS